MRGAEVKHAVKAFLMAPLSEDQRERIALMLAAMVRLDEAQIAFVETILTPVNKEGPSPATTAPILPVVAPHAKKNG